MLSQKFYPDQLNFTQACLWLMRFSMSDNIFRDSGPCLTHCIGLVYNYGPYQPLHLYKQACFAGCEQTLPDATPTKGKINPFFKSL